MKSNHWILAFALALAPSAFGAATVSLINIDAPNLGLNDPTPVAPVGGNAGTTLGQQRQNALIRGAQIWADSLTSSITITIRVSFAGLSCTATGGTLAQAGPRRVWSFNSAPSPIRIGAYYPQALANKLANVQIPESLGLSQPDAADLSATFNSNIGQANCIAGGGWYYGLDQNQAANQTNLSLVAVHEFAHGLGFLTTTSGTTGAQLNNIPYAGDFLIFDTTQNKSWPDLTAAERVASAINFRRVVWNGPATTMNSTVLNPGTPLLSVSGVAAGPAAGNYPIGTASFGPPLSAAGVSGDIMPVIESGALGLACNPLTGANALAVSNNIALVSRGVCSFAVKARNVQAAGARGMILVNNVAGSAPSLGGSDPLVTIPSVGISQADGQALLARLATRSRTRSGVVANLILNLAIRSGADAQGRLLLFTPNPFQGGSSVSHFDTSASPNLIMEPSYSADLKYAVAPPFDLTLPYLLDLGWGIP